MLKGRIKSEIKRATEILPHHKQLEDLLRKAEQRQEIEKILCLS